MSVGGAGVLSVVGESSLGIGCAWFAVIGGTSMTSMKGDVESVGKSVMSGASVTSLGCVDMYSLVGSNDDPEIGSAGSR